MIGIKASQTLESRACVIGPSLERFIVSSNPVISKVVPAPFGASNRLAQAFTDAPWPGEWTDLDNY